MMPNAKKNAEAGSERPAGEGEPIIEGATAQTEVNPRANAEAGGERPVGAGEIIDVTTLGQADETRTQEALREQGVQANPQLPDEQGQMSVPPEEGTAIEVGGEEVVQPGKLEALDPSTPVQPGSALDPSLPLPESPQVALEPEDERPVGI